MKRLVRSTGFAILAASLAACIASADRGQLVRRAGFDLQCPSDQLQTTQIDDQTVGVSGCGQRATYVQSCDGPRDKLTTECTWIKNASSDESTTSRPAPATTPAPSS